SAGVLRDLPAAVARAGVLNGELEPHGFRHYLCTTHPAGGLKPAPRTRYVGAAFRRPIDERMSDISRRRPIGAEVQRDGSTHFRVWAPEPREIALRIEAPDG